MTLKWIAGLKNIGSNVRADELYRNVSRMPFVEPGSALGMNKAGAVRTIRDCKLTQIENSSMGNNDGLTAYQINITGSRRTFWWDIQYKPIYCSMRQNNSLVYKAISSFSAKVPKKQNKPPEIGDLR